MCEKKSFTCKFLLKTVKKDKVLIETSGKCSSSVMLTPYVSDPTFSYGCKSDEILLSNLLKNLTQCYESRT